MRMIACVVLTCALLARTALAAPRTPLENIYELFIKAHDCAEQGLSFEPDDIAKLAAAVKQSADASGLTPKQRDRELQFAKNTDGLVATNQEWCNAARNSLSNAFPGTISLKDDSPL